MLYYYYRLNIDFQKEYRRQGVAAILLPLHSILHLSNRCLRPLWGDRKASAYGIFNRPVQ